MTTTTDWVALMPDLARTSRGARRARRGRFVRRRELCGAAGAWRGRGRRPDRARRRRRLARRARGHDPRAGAALQLDGARVLDAHAQLVTAQVVHASMLELAAKEKPGRETTSAMLARRTVIGQAILKTVDKAMETAGGVGFFRETGLERLFRDVQASRYHPAPEKMQTRFTGRVLLGLDIDIDIDG